MTKGTIAELFTSLQGEGIYAGVRQMFIRLYGCNLDCRFCDTKPTSHASYKPEEIVRWVEKGKGPYHSIAITGGEPLAQPAFLKELLPLLHRIDKKIYLETNGTLPEPLKELIAYVDIIAMDVKLPSATGLAPLWQAHREFLAVAHAKKVFIKAVITADTADEDIEVMRDMIAGIDPGIALVLQPVTPCSGVRQPTAGYVDELQSICASSLTTVTVVPQLHILAGIK
jgi:organic radical activating enzyme